MDEELLQEFLAETSEALGQLDNGLVQLEQTPEDPALLPEIFRVVHTIKGTCGFIGLPKLEAVAHAAEDVLGKFRDGDLEVTADRVTVVLRAIDRIKDILNSLAASKTEPDGDDGPLIADLKKIAAGETVGETPAAPEAAAPQFSDKATVSDSTTSEGAGSEIVLLEPKVALEFVDVEDVDPAPAATPSAETRGDQPVYEVSQESVAYDMADEVEPASAQPAAETPQPAPAPEASPVAEPAAKPETRSPSQTTTKYSAAPDPRMSVQSIRVGIDVLENLMNMVGELVLTRNQLVQITRDRDDAQLQAPMQRLSQVTSELQDGVMMTRMQPIANAWSILPRQVRDLSNDLGKKVHLSLTGENTELDRQVLELMRDPLLHMVRNACDHGLESPEARQAAGKPEVGQLALDAAHEGGHIIITISDDGRGLATEKIRARAVERGVLSEAEGRDMSDHQIRQLIFNAGFSTASAVTNLSGRGVGLDVVRENIEKIGGNVEVSSKEGAGTRFTVKIPLTLAIVNALIIECASERFAVPQIAVVELVRLGGNSAHRPEYINGAAVLRLRDRLLPLVSLRRVLDLDPAAERDRERPGLENFVIVCQAGTYQYGILVDRVQDTEEIVVKPVAPILSRLTMFSGNTILGDGSVVMILDPNGIAASTARAGDLGEAGNIAISSAAEAAANQADRAPVLLFRAGDGAPKGVMLSLVARLEEIAAESVETADGVPMVQYRDQLMPIMTINEGGSLPSSGRFPVIVFAENERSVGLAVDEIIDIVEQSLAIDLPAENHPGVIGTAVLAGKATEIIDVGHYLGHGLTGWISRGPEAAAKNARRLLLVDDSPFFRNLLTPLLTVAGYQVTTVDGGDAALRLREDGEAFDIIVSDVEMPGMNGFEFAEAVRSGTGWQDTPIVAVSSYATPSDLARGRDSGFVDYIAKFDRDALLTTLDSTLAARKGAA